MKLINIKSIILMIFVLFLNVSTAMALEINDTAHADLTLVMPSYFRIEPVTSPVLIANVVDRTGNLNSNLSTQFRVISNLSQTKKLYLNSVINTNGGREDSMFMQGGRVYVAFGNLQKPPTLNSLNNCKYGASPKESPGVVAYPITSLIGGTKASFNQSEGKYEVYVANGTTYITVNIGSHVLRSSFAANDPKGAYQAILSLTEADM